MTDTKHIIIGSDRDLIQKYRVTGTLHKNIESYKELTIKSYMDLIHKKYTFFFIANENPFVDINFSNILH